MFYNTNHLSGAELKEAQASAATQQEVVMTYFRARPYLHISPCKIWKEVLSACPLTSVRRAITTLTGMGLLTRTDTMVSGPYGRPVHTWKLATGTPKPGAPKPASAGPTTGETLF